MYKHTVGPKTYEFKDLKTLLAKASPERSGDRLAGIAADSHQERAAAQFALADVPLSKFLEELIIPYEEDDAPRLIVDNHEKEAFGPVSHFTVGDFRNWLLTDKADAATLRSLSPGITPEMAAAVSKIMGLQDLVA
ncbi:MAG: ethanolamine ammonia-lyase subunit EutB, partial [Nitrospirota bacterium]